MSRLFFVLVLVALRARVQEPVQELRQAVGSLQQGHEATQMEMGELKALVKTSAKPSPAAAKAEAAA